MILLWILAVIFTPGYCVRFEENGYKGITVSFSKGTSQESFDFGKLKDVLKNATELLFHATRRRSYFEEFIFVLPPTWSETDICDENVTDIPKNVDIYVTDTTDVSSLTAQNSRGCRKKGDIIYLPKNWLTGDTEELALQFVQKWSVFRYGVFPEDPETYGSCIANSDSTWSPVGCYNVDMKEKVKFHEDGLPVCYFPADFNKREDLFSSIMFSSNSSTVLNFCDGSESFPHNPVAPTLHNRICEGNTVWSVIMDTEDFLHSRNLPLKDTKPPNIPTFRCFKETKTHLTLVVEDTDSEARTEIRYALFHFLSIIESTDFSVSLATFSNDSLTEEFEPVELNLKDKDRLKKFLDLHIMNLNDEVPNICLACGLRKAYEISRKSPYPLRVVILLARESSLENAKGSELIQLIQSDTNVVPYLLFLEDTKNDVIPSSLVDAVQERGGRIFRLKNDAVFMLTELTVALLDASKNVLHLEDKILVMHKEVYLNVKSNIVDVFLTPKHVKGKLLYSMQCKKRGEVRNEGKSCDDPDTNIPSYICRSEVDISAEENSEKVWRHSFRYSGGITGTTCSSLALLKLEPSSTSPFTLKGWLSENKIIPGRNALIIYAEIFGSTKQDVQVEARISGPGLEEFRLQLRDNGNGDPDIIKEDNIYSRYFTSFTQKGTYTVSIYAELLGADGKRTEENFAESAKSVTQTKVIGTFRVMEPPPTEDIFPPNQVSDLKVILVNNTNRKILLQWTAPGDDYDFGKASEYELYFTNDWRNLQESLVNKILSASLDTSEIIPKINGNEEKEEFQLPNISLPTIYYIALKALDKNGNKGKLSNIIQVPIMFEENYKNETNNTDTEVSTEIVSSFKEDAESNQLYWYIVTGVVFSAIFLIIVINILVWVFCFKKHKKVHETIRIKDVSESSKNFGTNINSDENILKSENEENYKYERSEEITQNQGTFSENSSTGNPLMVYAKVEKRDKSQKPTSRTSHNTEKYKDQHLSNHRESYLGYV